jgi:hypothetical protein
VKADIAHLSVDQLTARAVKFIRDLAYSHDHQRTHHIRHHQHSTPRPTFEKDTTKSTQDILEHLLSPGGAPVSWATKSSQDHEDHASLQASFIDPAKDAAEDLPEHFKLANSFLAILIRPQFLLRSALDEPSQVVVSTLVGVLRTFTVEDTNTKDDPVNSVVLHRSYGELRGVQAFCPRVSSKEASFVPLEVLLDNKVDPYDFDRILPATKAMIRYDKFNRLRIAAQTSDQQAHGSNAYASDRLRKGIDEIALAGGRLAVFADPAQYAAIYNVVTNLILYSEPGQRKRTEKLEAALLVSDFSDLHKRADVVYQFQQRMRESVRILRQRQGALELLGTEERRHFFTMQAEFLKESERLSLEIAAIRHSQLRREGNPDNSNSGVRMSATASEMVWYMLDNEAVPFVKVGINGVSFDWLSKSDSSVTNALMIRNMQALNCTSDHMFTEIIAKYQGSQNADHRLADPDVFLVVLWTVLPAVGGISIVENFEMHLHPMTLQLERKVGDKLTNYVFAQRKRTQPGTDTPKSATFAAGPGQSDIQLRSRNRSDDAINTGHPLPPRRSLDQQAGTGFSAGSRSQSSSSISTMDRSLRHTISTERLGTAGSAKHPHTGMSSSSSFPNGLSLESETGEPGEDPGDQHYLDVEEMKQRAKSNRTFVAVKISPTVICLSYKSVRKNSLTDVYGLLLKTPTFTYKSQTWSYYDLLSAAKKGEPSLWRGADSLLNRRPIGPPVTNG